MAKSKLMPISPARLMLWALVALALFVLLLTAGAAVPALGQAPAGDQPLGNQDIVKMAAAGLGDSLIIAKIRTSKCKFDTSLDAILQLKQAGVSDAVMEAMIEAIAASEAPPAALPATSSVPVFGPPEPAEAALEDSPSLPLAFLITPEGKRVLPRQSPVIAQARTKNRDLGSMAAEDAMNQALGHAVSTASSQATAAAYSAAGSMAGSALGSVAGGLGTAVMLGLRNRKPTITYVWALPNQSSATALYDTKPRIEVRYEGVGWVNPDEFVPKVIRLAVATSNYRLVSATTHRGELHDPDAHLKEIVEQTILIKREKVGAGRYELEPVEPLPPGEYAVVLRPASQATRLPGSLVTGEYGASVLFNSVWAFSVRMPQ